MCIKEGAESKTDHATSLMWMSFLTDPLFRDTEEKSHMCNGKETLVSQFQLFMQSY